MTNDLLPSLIRTYVPTIVGGLAGWVATYGIDIDDKAREGLAIFLAGLFTAMYYLAARLLESKFPKAGLLLGSTRKPEYTAPTK